MDYLIGDVVMLKSGGPSMTVEQVLNDDSDGNQGLTFTHLKIRGFIESAILCKWYEEPNHNFKPEMIKKV